MPWKMGSLCLWVRYDLVTRRRSGFSLWRYSAYCSVVMKMHHQSRHTWKWLSPEMRPACKLVLEAAEVLVADCYEEVRMARGLCSFPFFHMK